MSEEMENTISAYEKMLQDGSANKFVDMTMSAEPDLGEALGKTSKTSNMNSSPLGEATQNQINNKNDYIEDNYAAFDNHMESRINALRNKMKGGVSESGMNKVGKLMTPAQKEIQALKARVTQLEKVCMTLMQVQEQLLDG
jgi:hypothetical protein